MEEHYRLINIVGEGEEKTIDSGAMSMEIIEGRTEIAESWQFPDFASLTKDEIIENHIDYCDAYRNGYGKEILLDGIYFWYGQFKVSSRRPMLVNTSSSHVQMNFCIQNTTSYFSDSLTKSFVRFKPHQHNLMLLPERQMLVQWQTDQETEIFSINISPEFFFGTLPEAHPLSRHFKEGIDLRLPAFFSLRNLPVTPKMVSALFEILHCTYSGYHKSLFIKAKVIELLALQIEQYEHLPLPDITTSLKPEDVVKMHLARQILVENLEAPLSIKELAQQVGTNDYSLKKYFKEVFGTTVFGYLHDLRMEKAKEQLGVEGSKISEVAKKMGYKYATHFTAAFKKYYGFLPNKMRIGLLHVLHLSELFAEAVNNSCETFMVFETI